MYDFSSGYFWYFLFFFGFQQCDSDGFMCGFLYIYPVRSLLRFLDTSVKVFINKFGKFLVIISSSIILLPHSLSPLHLGLQLHMCRHFGIISQVTIALNFFQYYFLGFQIRWFLLISLQSPNPFLYSFWSTFNLI